MQDFRKLRVWHAAKALCLEVYRVTAEFPKGEQFGLVAQMRRSARSICGNIAEGCGYVGSQDSARMYQISVGSATELWSDLIIANELRFVSDVDRVRLENDLVAVRKQTIRLLQCARSSR